MHALIGLAIGLRVVATVPDLGSLVQTVGGEAVELTTLTQGPQDPHYLEPRPSFVRRLHEADLFLLTGMDLEIGWVPVLLQGARNGRILPGAPGYLDASRAIEPLQVPGAGADRSRGDLHPYGNPHYLTDPLNGLRVSALIRDRLSELDPEHAAGFRERQAGFERALLERLVGEELADSMQPDALVRAVETGSLDPERLGGWLGALRGRTPARALEEHQLWIYFARRFGLEIVATLEPFPGIAPTTRHLARLVEQVRAGGVRVILSTAYFDPRHARWVAERTGAHVVALAHQTGARPGADDYLATVDYNVHQLAEGLGAP